MNLPKDIIISISLELDLPLLVELSIVSQKFNNIICDNDIFWMNRFRHDIGIYSKSNNMSWKDFYRFSTRNDLVDALFEAVENGFLELIKIYVNRGANIRAYAELFLRSASEHGHLEVVKYLVRREVNALDRDSEALEWASRNGNLEVVKYLVEQGSDINSHYNQPLWMASRNGHLEVVKYLVGQGANVRTYTDEVLKVAKQNKHLKVVKYLGSLYEKI